MREGINDNEMHLIKKELRNSFYSIHGTVENQSSIAFLLRFKSIFSEQNVLFNNFQPNKREGNCSFPNTTYTHSCNKGKQSNKNI